MSCSKLFGLMFTALFAFVLFVSPASASPCEEGCGGSPQERLYEVYKPSVERPGEAILVGTFKEDPANEFHYILVATDHYMVVESTGVSLASEESGWKAYIVRLMYQGEEGEALVIFANPRQRRMFIEALNGFTYR